MAKQLTFVVTIGDDAPDWQHLRVALLLRKMAIVMEDNHMLPEVGFTQGHNFECIKLTKIEIIDAD